jgi:PPE-repeat protein
MIGSVEGECKLSTGGGNVHVKNVVKGLVVATGGGNIKSGNVGKDLNVVTGGGNISLDKVAGEMTITTGGGNILGAGSTGGKISTGSGNVRLKNLSGGIKVSSGAGNVETEFVSVGSKESKIVSGNGNITVYIPENAKVTIEARVKFTEGNTWTIDKKKFSEVIKSEFEASNEDLRKGEYHAVYKINGGGTDIYLQTSIGTIEIKKLKR